MRESRGLPIKTGDGRASSRSARPVAASGRASTSEKELDAGASSGALAAHMLPVMSDDRRFTQSGSPIRERVPSTSR